MLSQIKKQTKIFLFILLISQSFTAFADDNKYIFEGDLKQGGLVTANLPKGVTPYLNGKIVQTYNNKLLLGFHIDANEDQRLVLKLPNGKNLIQNFKIEQRKYEVQKINNLPKEMVTPPASVYTRIANDNKSVKIARNEVIKDCNLEEGWVMPTQGAISGVYGSKRILNGKSKQPHYGIDIAAEKGTPIISPKSGTVTLVNEDMYYTGKTVIINHGCGLTSTFLHMDKINVNVGDKVSQNQKIGEVGSTGRSTGAHLDWRVNLFNIRLDPQLLID